MLLHDAAEDVMRLHIMESEQPTHVRVGPNTTPVESPGGVVWQTQQPMVIADYEQETRFPRVSPVWRGYGMRSGYYLPLTTAQRRLGAINFASRRPRGYDPRDLHLFQQVAHAAAVAVDNALNFQQSQCYQKKWRIGGPSGAAAARLRLKRTTLQSKMRKLGIARPG